MSHVWGQIDNRLSRVEKDMESVARRDRGDIGIKNKGRSKDALFRADAVKHRRKRYGGGNPRGISNTNHNFSRLGYSEEAGGIGSSDDQEAGEAKIVTAARRCSCGVMNIATIQSVDVVRKKVIDKWGMNKLRNRRYKIGVSKGGEGRWSIFEEGMDTDRGLVLGETGIDGVIIIETSKQMRHSEAGWEGHQVISLRTSRSR